MVAQLDLLRVTGENAPIRFVIFVSYGNDSIALLQWAHENNLEGVAVVFTDTGWMADGWSERVDRAEAWVKSIGFRPFRTKSIGFRREESEDRRNFPEYLANSENHGGRFMLAPLVEWTAEQRNELIRRAGFEVYPSRSRECRCINSNRSDMRAFTEADWTAIRNLESEIGKTMYRPYRHMGADGADEVRKWAESERGQYEPPEPMEGAVELEDAPDEPDMFGNSGQCDTFGGCGR